MQGLLSMLTFGNVSKTPRTRWLPSRGPIIICKDLDSCMQMALHAASGCAQRSGMARFAFQDKPQVQTHLYMYTHVYIYIYI